MHFTRDPIIETVISPKDGFKLSVRNSRIESTEEYIVNAIEVVSFGSALFFRSIEKPKAFLLPVADYEVVEVKEARMVLKNVSLEKPIKIGDGKENKSDEKDNSKKEGSQKDGESKKNSRKRTSRKKRSAKADKESSKEEQKAKDVSAEKTEVVDSMESEKKDNPKEELSAPPAPIVFPTPPKIISRKVPEEIKDNPTDANVEPAEPAQALEVAPHHEKEEPVEDIVEEMKEEVENSEHQTETDNPEKASS